MPTNIPAGGFTPEQQVAIDNRFGVNSRFGSKNSFSSDPANNSGGARDARIIGGSGRTAAQRDADLRAGLAERKQTQLIRQSIAKNAAIKQQFGSYGAWILAGSPPYEYAGQIWTGANTRGIGGKGEAKPEGWITPSPGNTNPNGYDITKNLSSLEASGRDVSAARRGEQVRAHNQEVFQFYKDNPDKAPAGFDPNNAAGFGAPSDRSGKFGRGRSNRTGRIGRDSRTIDSGLEPAPLDLPIQRDAPVVEGQNNDKLGLGVSGISSNGTQTTLDRAAPFQQSRAGVQGQEGGSVVNRKNDFTDEQKNRRSQQLSQTNSFSGNRRFRPASGA